jgi:protein-S-isoprenylcysteine O-methyltransferase Ste14
MTTAPWVYRHRFIVFGLLYGFSFFFGYVIAGVAGISTQPSYRALGNREVLATVALVCALGGFCLRVWASSYLSSAIVWHGDPRSGELRVSGPYRFTRNPLYLGNILQAIAIGLVAPWPVLVLVVIGMIAYSYVLIAIEERFLSTMQGETYERYKRSVARLVPIPGRIAPAGTQRASLADGLRAESVIGLLSLAVFAIVFLTWR